jgi:hypothetical protein
MEAVAGEKIIIITETATETKEGQKSLSFFVSSFLVAAAAQFHDDDETKKGA